MVNTALPPLCRVELSGSHVEYGGQLYCTAGSSCSTRMATSNASTQIHEPPETGLRWPVTSTASVWVPSDSPSVENCTARGCAPWTKVSTTAANTSST